MRMTFEQYKKIESGITSSIQDNVQYPDLKEFLPQHLLKETLLWLKPEKTKNSKYIIVELDEIWERNGSHLPNGMSKTFYTTIKVIDKEWLKNGFEDYETDIPERILGYLE